jgi:hypothetical protein
MACMLAERDFLFIAQMPSFTFGMVIFFCGVCVCVLAARCGELELSLYLSLFARACVWVCVCLSASRSFKTPPNSFAEVC